MHHAFRPPLTLLASSALAAGLLSCGSDAGLLLAERRGQAEEASTPPVDPPPTVPPTPTAPSPDGVGTDTNDCVGQYINADEMWTAIQADLATLDEEDQPFTRYLSLTNQYNAGVCSDALGVYRSALHLALNSLSDESNISRATPIDSNQLVYRIDMRDYGWDFPVDVDSGAQPGGVFSDKWEAIVGLNDFAAVFQGPQAEGARLEAHTDVPLLMADALVARSTLGNLYYELVGIPSRRSRLLGDLEVDERRNQLSGQERRAGTTRSLVTRTDRLVTRNPVGFNRALWQSFDYRVAPDVSSLFVEPFVYDFGKSEAIFTLNNGLPAFAVFGPTGERIEEFQLLTDDAEIPSAARVGLSCLSCHSQGVLPVTDEVLGFATANLFNFSATELGDIERTYMQPSEVEFLQEQDNGVFLSSVESATSSGSSAAGASLNSLDSIRIVVERFNQPLSLNAVAGELGVTPSQLEAELPALDERLAQALRDGGTIRREAFAQLFLGNYCLMQALSQNRPDDSGCESAIARLEL